MRKGVDNEGAIQRFFSIVTLQISQTNNRQDKYPHGSFVQTTVEVSGTDKVRGAKSATMKLIPYYAWNNRGPCLDDRVVPLKRTCHPRPVASFARPRKAYLRTLTASHTSKSDTVNAIGDRVEPRWSSGNKTPRWTSRGQEGKPQTITGEFHGTKQIRSIGFGQMDHYQHPVKFPKEWKVETSQRWQMGNYSNSTRLIVTTPS